MLFFVDLHCIMFYVAGGGIQYSPEQCCNNRIWEKLREI